MCDDKNERQRVKAHDEKWRAVKSLNRVHLPSIIDTSFICLFNNVQNKRRLHSTSSPDALLVDSGCTSACPIAFTLCQISNPITTCVLCSICPGTNSLKWMRKKTTKLTNNVQCANCCIFVFKFKLARKLNYAENEIEHERVRACLARSEFQKLWVLCKLFIYESWKEKSPHAQHIYISTGNMEFKRVDFHHHNMNWVICERALMEIR